MPSENVPARRRAAASSPTAPSTSSTRPRGIALAAASAVRCARAERPGLPIIAMGAMAAALTGAGPGGALGAIIGGLVGAGIPEDRARMYDRGIREGGIVMGVNPRAPQDAEYFEREWTSCGAEQVYCPTLRSRDAA